MKILESRKEKSKNKKGISLIALIITIIVIVLLAAIVVNTSINTPASANLAKFMQDMGEVQQAVALSYLDEYTVLAAQNSGVVDKEAIYESIAKGTQSESVVYDRDPQFEEMGIIGATTAWKIQGTDKIVGINTLPNYDNKDYYITDNGIIFLDGGYSKGGNTYYNSKTSTVGEAVTPTPGELPEDWIEDNLNEDSPYILDSGTNTKVPIPRGYVASTINGETTVNEGLVIKEGTDGSKTNGINEFVWIPVPEVTDMYWIKDGQKVGQLWATSIGNNFGTKNEAYLVNSGLREPAIVDGGACDGTGSGFDGVGSNIEKMGIEGVETSENLLAHLKREFNNMIESVEIYGGFYIGRYELGYNNNKVVCQKDVSVLTAYNNNNSTYSTWYGLYKAASEFTTNNVTSSMIWGSQWDRVMNWMLEDAEGEEGEITPATYVMNSTNKGHYNSENEAEAGSNDAYKVKNIYDMAGNVSELTFEAYSSVFRVGRGGNCSHSGSSYPASSRIYDYSVPTETYGLNGSRSMLYINN